ncbi:MAG: gluconeogenesis factor YvcK family protein, partial [Bryobacteraceae bacterium]
VPRRVRPLAAAMQAIEQATLIVLGPGSLYTSVLPNLLVSGVTDAIAKSRATRVYISNLMTQPGETPGYSVPDHVRAIYQHTGKKILDWVVINHQKISPEVARRYKKHGAEPSLPNVHDLQRLGLRCVFDDLLEEHGVVRHNSLRLAKLLVEEFVERRPGR